MRYSILDSTAESSKKQQSYNDPRRIADRRCYPTKIHRANTANHGPAVSLCGQQKGKNKKLGNPSSWLRCMYGCFSNTRLISVMRTGVGVHRALSSANPSPKRCGSEGSAAVRMTVECIMSGMWSASLREQTSGSRAPYLASNSTLSCCTCCNSTSGKREGGEGVR